MPVDLQHVGRAQHEQAGMAVNHGFLKGNQSVAENIAQQDGDALKQHHQQCGPCRNPPEQPVELVYAIKRG